MLNVWRIWRSLVHSIICSYNCHSNVLSPLVNPYRYPSGLFQTLVLSVTLSHSFLFHFTAPHFTSQHSIMCAALETRKKKEVDLSRVPDIERWADLSLISYLKIIASINRNKEILKYRSEPRLTLNGKRLTTTAFFYSSFCHYSSFFIFSFFSFLNHWLSLLLLLFRVLIYHTELSRVLWNR